MGGHSPSSDSGSADAPNTKKSKVTKVKGEGGLVDFIKKGGVVRHVVKGIKKAYKTAKTNKELQGNSDWQGSKTKSRVKDITTGKDNDHNNNEVTKKSIEQPKVVSQMDNTDVKSKLITADKTSPTTIEMAQLTDDERMLKVKRGRKTKTVLTDMDGLNTKPTLSQKALLS